YRNYCDYRGVFQLENIEKANLETLETLLNVNILKIGDESNPEINWELRNGFLRYYDKTSQKRLYIKSIFLEYLKLNNDITFNIKTKFTESHYIEYYVAGIDTESYDKKELYDKTINE